MFDNNSALFWLIIGILTLITACLLLIAYEMAKRDMEKNRLHTKKRSDALKECAYFFGFLSGYPLSKPVPDECFGCTLVLSCIRAIKPTNRNSMGKDMPPLSRIGELEEHELKEESQEIQEN